MRYCCTSISSIRGLSLAGDVGEKELIMDAFAGMRAIVTSDPDTYAFEGDRRLAVAGMMLGGLTRAGSAGGDTRDRLPNAIDELRASRRKELGGDAYLVCILEGNVPTFSPSCERDFGDFVACFDGADITALKAEFNRKVTPVLSAITATCKEIVVINKWGDAVVFFREDGKPVYPYTASVSGAAYVSHPLREGEAVTIAELYRIFADDGALTRVQWLIRASLETNDSLRSFLSAWAAVEIFVNKVFSSYESQFFDEIRGGHSRAEEKYLKRIREVMKDKYRLTDKFAAIALQLSPTTADEDLEIVTRVKSVRDELSHGSDVDEAMLPVRPIRDVGMKYLRLHLEARAAK